MRGHDTNLDFNVLVLLLNFLDGLAGVLTALSVQGGQVSNNSFT